MANNRLFIAEPNSKQWIMISKGFGSGWGGLTLDKMELLSELISIDELIIESDVNCKTSLKFFTEYDEIHDVVFSKNSGWKEFKP